MVFSEKLRNYISLPSGMSMGTRDATLKPEYQRVLGARAVGGDQIQFFFDHKTAGRTLDNIRDNGQVTLVICSLPYMESFQFKGICLEYRACNEEELQFFNTYMKGFNDAAVMMGLGDGLCYNYPHSEMWSITMEVERIFEQTPRIGTGQQVV